MSNTQAVCNSFKLSQLTGGAGAHDLGASGNNIKGALYFASATYNKSTTAYNSSGEVAASGTYVATGLALTKAAPALSGDTACWTPGAAFQVTGFTAAAFDCLLVYNDTKAGKDSIAVYTFGSQTINNGAFTLNMPANTAGNAAIQLG